MIMDTQTEFSVLQSIAAAAGDVVSTNIYDTGAAADVGIGEEDYLIVRIGTAVVGAGATVQFVLQTATDAAFTTPVEYPLTAAVGVANLTANSTQVKARLPIGLRRYLRVVYRIAGATTTAGTASAFVVNDPQAQQYGAVGYSVA